MNYKALPSQALLRERFDYDPASGEFRYKNGDLVCPESKSRYLLPSVNGERYLIHRLIWKWMTGEDPLCEVDHRDRNKRNNKWNNLRLADSSQNQGNIGSFGKSRFRGVCWNKPKGMWRAQLRSKAFKRIKDFITEEEAALAWNQWAVEAWGEFAFQNEMG